MPGVGTHDAVSVAVNLRDDDLPVLPGQGGGCGQLPGSFVFVKPVNGEDEGAVLGQGHFLGVGVQAGDRTVRTG